MAENVSVNAVHEVELRDLLESLGFLDRINQGEVVCVFCEEVVDLNNIQAIIPEKDNISFCCKNVNCCAELMRRFK